MNTVIIMGRLTKDPELRYSGELPVCKFTLAVDRPKKRDGTKDTDFPSCVAFGQTAETISQYVKKGQRILITGHISTGKYTKDDGTTVYTTDIGVDRFDFIEKREEPAPAGFEVINDSDFPF